MAIQNVCWIYSSGAGPGTLFGPLASLDDYRRHLRNGGALPTGLVLCSTRWGGSADTVCFGLQHGASGHVLQD